MAKGLWLPAAEPEPESSLELAPSTQPLETTEGILWPRKGRGSPSITQQGEEMRLGPEPTPAASSSVYPITCLDRSLLPF